MKQFSTKQHNCCGKIINNTNHPNNKYFMDYVSYRKALLKAGISVAVPGMVSGLYKDDGPLNVCNCNCVSSQFIGISATATISLELTFMYSDSRKNKVLKLNKGDLYIVDFVEDFNIKRCIGKLVDIYKVYDLEEENLYKLSFDCSSNYTNQTIVMKTDQIRNIDKYIQYSEEDPTIANSYHRYGTTVGLIKCAVVKDATVDKNGNIIEGNIVEGIVDGTTSDGIATGENSSHHNITTINSTTIGGRILGGMILNGIVRSGDIDGVLDKETFITEHATVRGIISSAVIINTTIEDGNSSNGTVIDPTIEDSTVTGAIITGDDMITTGGITCGDITTGGTTVGGTVQGGTASGMIGDDRYNIEGGTTTGDNLVTTGGIVTGGTIVGGQHIGNVIIGAIIHGGTCSNGVTTGGSTTGGTLIPVISNQVPISKPIWYNPNYDKVNADEKTPTEALEENINNNLKKIDDLLVWTNENTGEVGSNIGTATIESVKDIPNT